MSRLQDLLSRFDRDALLTEPAAVAGRDRAVLELMLLQMFADLESAESERAIVREFAMSRPWPIDTDPDVEIDRATAAVRAAFIDAGAMRDLVVDLCVRLDHDDDRKFALDHVTAIMEADGTIEPREAAFLAEIRASLGLPPGTSDS